jgi:hypothetical protein
MVKAAISNKIVSNLCFNICVLGAVRENPSFAGLDRFLFNGEWSDAFPNNI